MYKKLLLAMIFAAAAVLLAQWLPHHAPSNANTSPRIERGKPLAPETAQKRHLSHVWVEGRGIVVKTLRDDIRGARHQRFLVRLSNGKTVLIVHNIDIAPRLNGLRKGDLIEFSGEFIDNDKGGLVHWTHHDPSHRKRGGWLKWRGRIYR
jgi:hypothetical protein